MISLVRRKAGLAVPAETFTNIPNENLNSTIKKWQNFEKKSWIEFIEKLEKLSKSQFTEAQKAIYRSGEMELANAYRNLFIDPVNGLKMSGSARNGALFVSFPFLPFPSLPFPLLLGHGSLLRLQEHTS